MTMSDDEDERTEVEEEEIEAVLKERRFELGETEVELEDAEPEEDDYTGDREGLVGLLIDINENCPVDVNFGEEADGDEAEEEEIEPVLKTRDPNNDLIYHGQMREVGESLFGDEEWEAVDPAGEGGGDE